MPDFKVREYSNDEYLSGLRKELKEKGLHDSIKERCDLIFEDTRKLNNSERLGIIESLNEILDLVKEAGVD